MKLQWLPRPNSKGGWDLSQYDGFDRVGDVISTVKEVRGETHEWSYHWKIEYNDNRYQNKDDAIAAAESEIKNPFGE